MIDGTRCCKALYESIIGSKGDGLVREEISDNGVMKK